MSDSTDSSNYETTINSPDFNESGKNAQEAIKDGGQALQIARKLEWNDRERDIRRARVLAAFNGASPYSDGELVQKGQGYRYNVSFGFIEGVIGRAVVPYNELTVNVSDLTEIEAELPDEKLSIVQAEFSKIMERWGKWPKTITRLNQDLVINGYNTMIFPSDYDPFPIFVPQKHGFVDEGSPNDVNDLELFVWKKTYLIHELYAKIADPDVAKKAGWNVDNVREALMEAAPVDPVTGRAMTSGQWTEVESLIRGGSMWSTIIGAKKVDTYHTFASEIDGKVSHRIVFNRQNSDKMDGPELFTKDKRFDAMRDFLVYFDLETGDGTWHGSRGVGQRAFNTHKAIDKIRCSLLDQAFVSGLTLLQPGDQLSQEELQLSVVGPFAVLPQGVTIGATTLPAISQTSFLMDSLLTATSEQRIGDVVPSAQNTLTQGPTTATQAKISADRQQLITKGNLKRYVDPVSQVVSIIVRRLLKPHSPNAFAKEFQKVLKEKGLSEADLKNIRGARNTGRIDDVLGNTAAATQIIFGEFRGDPDIDQFKLKDRRISSVLDADAAHDLIISDKDQTRAIESSRLQEFEITTMNGGLGVPVSPRDNHEVHLEVLLGDIGLKVQQQAQNFNPAIIPILKNEVSHGDHHIRFLEQDKIKKNIAKPLKSRLKDAVGVIKDLEKQAMQIAEANFKEAARIAQTPEERQQAQAALDQLKGSPRAPAEFSPQPENTQSPNNQPEEQSL